MQSYTQQNNGFAVCDGCGAVVWEWTSGTHDSWHDQIDSIAEDASLAVRALILDLDEVLKDDSA